MKKTASVVIVTYRRTAHIHEIVRAWAKQSDDVWLCDCTKNGLELNTSEIKIARFSPDPGNKVRHAVATLTSGDICIKADDDILPLPGLAADFLHWYGKLGDCVMGIHGRTFEGTDYYRDTTMYASHKQKEPRRVDFLGVITCASRNYLGMDLKGCLSPIEDIFWHNYKYPDAPKFVIPTKNFKHFETSRDAERLCANKPARALRRAYYTEMFKRFYT